MSPQDDKANLADIEEARDALSKAELALRKAMAGLGQQGREAFVFHLGFARGRLYRVTERIYRAGEADPDPPANDDAEERGSEG